MLLKYKPGDEAVVLKLDSQFPERSYSLCYRIESVDLNGILRVVSQFPERSYSLCYMEERDRKRIARLERLSIP